MVHQIGTVITEGVMSSLERHVCSPKCVITYSTVLISALRRELIGNAVARPTPYANIVILPDSR
jgi:hypothetical protein